MSTVLCRCFTHTRMLRAIRRYAHRLAEARRRREGVRAGVNASRRDFLKSAGALIVSFSSVAALRRRPRPSRRGRSRPRISGVAQAARFVARDRRRRPRHRLHRQVRARPGHLHRADAAGRRRAVGAARPRHADSVRHLASRPIRARPPAASRRRPISTRPIWRRRARPRARRCCSSAAERLGVPVDQLTVADGVIGVQGDASQRVSYGELVGGQKFNLTLNTDRQAQARERVDGARQAGRPRRHAGDGDRDNSSSCTTCACPACCTAASCGRRPSAPRWSASTRARSATCPAS